MVIVHLDFPFSTINQPYQPYSSLKFPLTIPSTVTVTPGAGVDPRGARDPRVAEEVRRWISHLARGGLSAGPWTPMVGQGPSLPIGFQWG